MMRVRFEQVPGRAVPYFTVSLCTEPRWLVGFIHQTPEGRWVARRRGNTVDRSFAPGWTDRTAAAEWLLLDLRFAQRPALQVAA